MQSMNYLSIDIGGTYTKFGLIDHSGNFVKTWKQPTAKTLTSFKQMLQNEIQTQESKIKGIAMSCPGRVDSTSGYIYTGGSLLFLYDFAIKEWLRTITALPFSIINDGKAAALAEWWIGNLKEIENGAAVVLGTGIGGGLILDNRLYQGPHSQAGELSFLIRQSEVKEKSQMYGYHGSAVRFINEATKIVGTSSDDYKKVFEVLAEKSDEELGKLFKNYCRTIAVILVNMQVLLDLEKIVIGGGISAQKLLIDTVNEQYEQLLVEEPLLKQTFSKMMIEGCAFRNSSNLLGALYQLLQQLDKKSKG